MCFKTTTNHPFLPHCLQSGPSKRLHGTDPPLPLEGVYTSKLDFILSTPGPQGGESTHWLYSVPGAG